MTMKLNEHEKSKQNYSVEKIVVQPKIVSDLKTPDPTTDDIVAMGHLSAILRPKDNRFKKR